MRIVVTRKLPEAAADRLRTSGADLWVSPEDRELTPAELRGAVSGADGVVTMLHDRVDEEFLQAAGRQLKVVANVAVGYDNIDVAAAAQREVSRSRTLRVCSPMPPPTWR